MTSDRTASDSQAERRRAELEANMARAAAAPHLRQDCCLAPGEDLWVFGYGSLMWNPGIPHVETRVGTLHGFHRRFCIWSSRYRGTVERPGLVLGLDRGGCCRGLLFRVPAGEVETALDYLHQREMMTRVYRPERRRVESPQGPVTALCFIVDRRHSQYTGRLTAEQTAAIIADAAGQRGPCADYLANTVQHLEALGVGAGSLKQLLRLVRRRCQDARGA
jgi:cation transport protein ChaC